MKEEDGLRATKEDVECWKTQHEDDEGEGFEAQGESEQSGQRTQRAEKKPNQEEQRRPRQKRRRTAKKQMRLTMMLELSSIALLLLRTQEQNVHRSKGMMQSLLELEVPVFAARWEKSIQ